jgi:hypothetical protein
VDEVLGNQEVVVKNLGPAAGASARPGRHDGAGFGCRGADLQPGGVGAVYGEQARRLSADQAQPEVMEQQGAASDTGAGLPAPVAPVLQAPPQIRWSWWWTTPSPCAV